MEMMLNQVRLSFPELFVPTTVQGMGKPKYRAVFLVPADSPLKKKIDAAVKAVAVEKWGAKANAVLANVINDPKSCCWQDGAKKEYDGYQGQWALSASKEQAKGRPLVLDADKTPLTESDGRPYAGCYVNAKVGFWCQDNQFGKGVRCELLGVQFAKDGDAFTAGGTADVDEFDVVSEGSDAADLV